MSQSTFSFSLQSPSRYGPRLGNIVLKRPGAAPGAGASSGSGGTAAEPAVEIATPGLLATTSRGAIPHLSRDHVRISDAIRWVNVPFETFLEHNPPIPTLQSQQHGGSSNPHPLHTFLGFVPNKHIVSMSARDPYDGREMPPNGNTHVAAYSLRGVRKVSTTDWRSYTESCQPDIVFALSDTPFTNPPYSQKRLTKSIERSAAWVASLLSHTPPLPTAQPKGNPKKPKPISNTANNAPPTTLAVALDTTASSPTLTNTRMPPIFVQLAGLASPAARKVFSDSLLEPLFGPEAEAVKPYKTLDEGIAGYAVDLLPLKSSVQAAAERKQIVTTPTTPADQTHITEEEIVSLLRTSLAVLPITKPRLVTAVQSPHEVLRYVGEVGMDLFDAGWAQKAADFGVGLDFEFPVRAGSEDGKKREIGHNFYDTAYRLDFGPLSDSFRGALLSEGGQAVGNGDNPICPCAACSPISPPTRIYHGYDTPSVSGEVESGEQRYLRHYTRAYIHHLLHTHEMSAHALLVMHNLAVLDAFFAGIRKVVGEAQSQPLGDEGHAGVEGAPGSERWRAEVRRFEEAYDGRLGVIEAARARWREVDLARGKGRLAREKEKQLQATVVEE